MSPETQGRYSYFFTITGQTESGEGGVKDSEGNYIMSNVGEALAYICGKETIVPTMLGEKRPIDLPKTDDPEAERLITFDEYSQWFEIKAEADGSTT